MPRAKRWFALGAGLYVAGALVLWALSWTFPQRVFPWVRTQAGMAWLPYLAPDPAAVALFAAMGLQVAGYLLALWACRAGALPGKRLLLGLPALCAVLYLLSGSLLSADAYLYMSYGRMNLLGLQPYIHSITDFPRDAVLGINQWWPGPSPYGPLWTALWTVFAAAAGEHLLIGLTLARLAGGAFYLLAILALWRLGEGRPWAAFAFAWNPLVLAEAWGNGRADVPLAALLLVALWCARRQRWLAGAAVLGVAVAVRFPAAVAVPVYVLACYAQPGARRLHRALAALAAAGLVALVVAAAYLPFWSGPATLDGLAAAGASSGRASVPGVLLWLLARVLPDVSPQIGWLLAAVPAALLWLAWRRWALPAAPPAERLAHDVWAAYLLYLFVVSPHLAGWYLVWPLALALAITARTDAPPGAGAWLAAGLTLWGLGLYHDWQLSAVWALPRVWIVLYKSALLAWPLFLLARYAAGALGVAARLRAARARIPAAPTQS